MMQKAAQRHDDTVLQESADRHKSRSPARVAGVIGVALIDRQEVGVYSDVEYFYDLFDLQDSGLVAA